jgi:hypothetical protein
MDDKLAFFDWDVGEGMEEAEFPEARKDLPLVKNNYDEVPAETITGGGEEDDGHEDVNSRSLTSPFLVNFLHVMISVHTFRNPFNVLRRDNELMADLLIAISMTHG